jgi:hypothetical protein
VEELGVSRRGPQPRHGIEREGSVKADEKVVTTRRQAQQIRDRTGEGQVRQPSAMGLSGSWDADSPHRQESSCVDRERLLQILSEDARHDCLSGLLQVTIQRERQAAHTDVADLDVERREQLPRIDQIRIPAARGFRVGYRPLSVFLSAA